MTTSPKTLGILLGGLAFLVFVLVVGGNELLKRIPGVTPPPGPLPGVETPSANNGQETEIINATQNPDTRPITFTESGFSSGSIMVRFGDAIGCLITIKNRSSAPLEVGVSPHNPTRDPGFDYPTIAPGSEEIIDVRYTDLFGVKLHSHTNPMHELEVIYGEGCK